MKFDGNRAWNDAVRAVSANREVLLVLAGVFYCIHLPHIGEGKIEAGRAPSNILTWCWG